MKFKTKSEKKEIDLTSMIDVTFLLISFFMMLINFSEADQNERIKLPLSELAKPPDQAPVEPMILQILDNGRTIYNNGEYDIPGLEKQIDFQKRLMRVLKTDFKKTTVIIRGDGHCEAGKVQDVIELCQKMGLENFKLRAKQGN